LSVLKSCPVPFEDEGCQLCGRDAPLRIAAASTASSFSFEFPNIALQWSSSVAYDLVAEVVFRLSRHRGLWCTLLGFSILADLRDEFDEKLEELRELRRESCEEAMALETSFMIAS